MKKQITLFVLIAAGVLVASAAVFAGALKPSEVCRDGGCYLVTTSVTGYTVDRDGDTVTITPTAGSVGGAAVPIGRVLWSSTTLGDRPGALDGKGPFNYPTDRDWLKKYINSNVIDLSTFPAASGQYAGMDRQPFLTSGPERRGSLTQAAAINLAQRLAEQGKVLAPNQIEWLEQFGGQAVPGTLYVTLFLRPDEAGEKWQVMRWNYLFEPDLNLALEGMPVPQCEPGQEGVPPDCSADPGDIAPPPAPPAEPDCPQGYIRDRDGWCRVPPEGWVPGGRVDPGLRFRLSD